MQPTRPGDIRESLRRELEAVRVDYMSLLEEIPESLWDQPVAPPRWTHKELMAHIDSYLSFVLPKTIAAARKGKAKAFPVPPKAIGDFFNFVFGRRMARKLTRQSLAAKYEADHRATLALLETIRDDEWEKRTKYPAGDLTIAEQFKAHRNHFDHHASQIRQSIARIRRAA